MASIISNSPNTTRAINRLHIISGVKNSGLGREGPRFAVEEMTELKMVVVNG